MEFAKEDSSARRDLPAKLGVIKEEEDWKGKGGGEREKKIRLKRFLKPGNPVCLLGFIVLHDVRGHYRKFAAPRIRTYNWFKTRAGKNILTIYGMVDLEA